MTFLPPDLRGSRRSAARRLAATFAAILELARAGRVELRQDRAFGPIYLRSRRRAARVRLHDATERLRLLEALLFASRRSRSTRPSWRSGCGEDADIAALLRELAEDYRGRGVNLVGLAGGWTFRTAPDLAGALRSERQVVRASCRAPRSRRWRSSPITSR